MVLVNIEDNCCPRNTNYNREWKSCGATPIFHALTGCDTLSYFNPVRKKTAWERWKPLNDVTEALLKLSRGSRLDASYICFSSCCMIKQIQK